MGSRAYPLRIITWNMGYWGHSGRHAGAWDFLLNELRPDVALLQECVPPAKLPSPYVIQFQRAYPASQRQRWGTALLTRGIAAHLTPLEDIEHWLGKLGPNAEEVCSATRLSGWCISATIPLPNPRLRTRGRTRAISGSAS